MTGQIPPNATENAAASSAGGYITDQEIVNLRHGVQLLRTQIQAGQLDSGFIIQQVDKMVSVLGRIEIERKARKKEGRFEALYNVSRLLGSSLDLQVVLDQVMDAVIQLTNAERGFLMLRDDDGDLAVKAARNLDQQTISSDKFKFSRTIANEVLDSGRHIITMNAAEDPRFAAQASIVSQSLRSIMAAPLWARGMIIGVAYVDSRVTVGLFDEDDLEALDALAGQAAITIDNARLFSATDQRLAAHVEELLQLRRIDRQLNETLDADKAMQYTLEWACRLTGATSGQLGLQEPDQHIRTTHQVGAPLHADANSEPYEYLDVAYPQVLAVVERGMSMLMDVDGRSVMLVPVRREHKVIGVVVLEREDEGGFTLYQQDLVERVVARAAVAIENARLYAAVQAADKAKSEFVGIVAHDLKVPMTSIMGYADLTRIDGNLSDQQSDFVDKIIDTVYRMEKLVSDLSDISRIESGHFFMNETRVSVSNIVKAMKDNTMTQIDAREHKFIEKIELDLPDMWVDYYRLLQVLTNLVSNAYKYTPNGGTIMVRARRIEGGAGEPRIEFMVRDSGVGLSPEQLAKLGTKFWRASDRYTRSQPGTGLGYSITRSLVEQMGSTIDVKSEVGTGSMFTFSIATATESVAETIETY
ncbi:MAG: GAF domain-containing protein [Burkholderiales bacterium]|nr:GAF domain-containing protein [Anaerolineae bacterium]